MSVDGLILHGRARGGAVLAAMALAGTPAFRPGEKAAAQGEPQAWRVECADDGKTLECRAI